MQSPQKANFELSRWAVVVVVGDLGEKRGTDKGCFRGSPARELEGGPFHCGEEKGAAKACISRTRAVESLGQILCLAPGTYTLIYIFV